MTVAVAAVSINGRMLQVNSENYFIKGVNYHPVPIGEYSGQTDMYNNSAIIDRDIPKLKALGVNTIRIYGVGNPGIARNYQYFLDQCYSSGIRVIFALYVPSSSNFADSQTREALKNSFVTMVNQFKAHPAILMWMFGNELNFNMQNDLGDLFSLINEARLAAHAAEGETWHPVCSSMADVNLLTTIAAYDSNVDVWAVQIYRGVSFFSLFADYAEISKKPLVITEFGIDAWDSRIGAVNESAQAQVDVELFNEIVKNNATCSGGLVFSFQDEWWKTGSVSSQEPTYTTCNAPDGTCSAEYYGICYISAGSPNGIGPREAYYSLQKTFVASDPYGTSSGGSNGGGSKGSNGGGSNGGGSGGGETSTETKHSSSLSTGAIVGIIAAAVIAAMIITFVVLQRRKQRAGGYRSV
eukprot:TRINITY_DN13388_c0_g1_i1.p1 TRINITY_DN13388_c0_g1~~TRINITY_DN13388_c0_g1_i1.p1  ORF type:complete len:434 (+),score=111.07 TRINITY_DN13388_c0_g1_i1:71-1303(+)